VLIPRTGARAIEQIADNKRYVAVVFGDSDIIILSVCLFVCMFVYSLKTREQLRRSSPNFRIASGRPRYCFRRQKLGCQVSRLIISWPVGYAAKRVQPTWLLLGRDDSIFIAHAQLSLSRQSRAGFPETYFPDLFACLSLCRPMYVCSLITREREGLSCVPGCPRIVLRAKNSTCLGQKFGEGVMGHARKLAFLAGPCRPCATASRLSTAMALDRL